MKWLNRVQLIGYLGNDPVVVTLSAGGYCATLTLATNSGYSKQGYKRVTSWHRIKVWGKDPASLQNEFIKGSHVMIEGSLAYRPFLDIRGITHWSAEIKAERLINLDR